MPGSWAQQLPFQGLDLKSSFTKANPRENVMPERDVLLKFSYSTPKAISKKNPWHKTGRVQGELIIPRFKLNAGEILVVVISVWMIAGVLRDNWADKQRRGQSQMPVCQHTFHPWQCTLLFPKSYSYLTCPVPTRMFSLMYSSAEILFIL